MSDQPNRNTRRLLSAKCAAQKLGFSVRALERRALEKDFPKPTKLGARLNYYFEDDLDRWIEGQRKGATRRAVPPPTETVLIDA
jgi:predicted DNA-binding transcriptional regulator AlpA